MSEHQERSRHTVIEGLRMRWEEEGDGPPVVLLHGIPTSPALWRRVMPMLTGYRSLAWEMVGYGDSIVTGHGRDISVGAQAEYLVGWMRAVGLERAVLVGHDLGGGVAQIAATRHPACCAGLVLVNSIGYDSWPIPSVRALRAVREALRRLPGAAALPVLATLMLRGHDDLATARESFRIHSLPYRGPGGGEALARQIAALDVSDTLEVADALPRLDVPARVVWGASDPFQKIGYGERFARDLPAPLLRLARGRHFVPEDHPDAVVEAVQLLFRDIEARGNRRRRASG